MTVTPRALIDWPFAHDLIGKLRAIRDELNSRSKLPGPGDPAAHVDYSIDAAIAARVQGVLQLLEDAPKFNEGDRDYEVEAYQARTVGQYAARPGVAPRLVGELVQKSSRRVRRGSQKKMASAAQGSDSGLRRKMPVLRGNDTRVSRAKSQKRRGQETQNDS